MKKKINQLIWIISIIFTYQISFANDQQDIDQEIFPTNINYNIDIPTPASFLGRPLGAAPVRHHELVSYLQLVANLSNRLTIETIGFSHERRPICYI